MSMQPIHTKTVFPTPDLHAIRRYRKLLADHAGAQSSGELRAQLLTVLDLVYRTDADLIRLLDNVCVTFEGLGIDVYCAAVGKLNKEGRTEAENLAFLSYQEELAVEMNRVVQAVRGHLDAMTLTLTTLLSVTIADTREPVLHAEVLLRSVGHLLDEAQKRALEFLLEDLKGPLNVEEARRGYGDEIGKLVAPLHFFCQNVLEGGDVIKSAEDFQQRIDELARYLRAVRSEWND